jgi:hypothetical protein
MTTSGTITMTMTELDRLKMVQAIVEMGLKPGRAAERLGLTECHAVMLAKEISAALDARCRAVHSTLFHP